MRTSLGFKFFIAITFCLSLTCNEKVFALHAQLPENALLQDTIDLPITPSDTIFEANVAEQDTLATPQPRKSGSGVILDQRVDYSAKDSIRFDLRRQVVHLWGNADLTYGAIHLTAAYVSIDFTNKELFAVGMPDSIGEITGNPVFTEGAQSFESKELRYNFETQKGRTVQVITEEADGFLHGDIVKIMDTKVIHVKSGKYTTCDNPNPHFHISFARAKILPNDKIISSAPRLTIMGVRTPLMLPFGFFPNTKGQASGVLVPSYGETNNRGFYLQNGGFYLGLNDYVDLSVTGDIYSRGSWGVNLGSNYKVRYRFGGSMRLSYSIDILGERNLPGYSRNRNMRVMWNHSQDPKARPNSVFRANVNAGSSQSSRFNPTSHQDYLSNTFSSNISYAANWAGRYNLSINARHSQNTNTRIVDLSLPEIAFSVARFYPLRRRNPQGPLRWYEEITMNYTSNASNQIKIPEEEMFSPTMFSNMKNGVQHSIPISHSFRVLKHFNLSNSINYTERWYFQKIERNWVADEVVDKDGWGTGFNQVNPNGRFTARSPGSFEQLSGQVVTDTLRGFYGVRDFNYSSSLNTRIYGMLRFSRGPLIALRHVVSPSIGFSFRPDFADDFWGYYDEYYDPNQQEFVSYSHYENGLYRVPPAGRSGAINFSMSNNLEMKVRSRKDTVSGEKKIALIDNLSISTSYDIARDSLNMSDIRLSGRTRLFGQFDVTYASSWSPYAADSLGRPINKFLWESDKKLLQLRNSSWSFNLNYNLSSKKKGSGAPPPSSAQRGTQPGGLLTEDAPMTAEEEPTVPAAVAAGVIDYSVPWNLRLSYSFNYNTNFNRRELFTERKIIQTLSASGDFNLTPNWRIGVSSGYNFQDKDFTYTSVDIYRDLHCWELTINWIPFGFRQSYNLTLRVKSSVLNDLKIDRRTHHLDRAFQ